MARVLNVDGNGDLNFTEKVVDKDKDNLSHPLTNIVQLKSVNGSPASDNTPSWLSATINEIGVQNGRWEEEVNVTIKDAEQNLTANTTYTFEFKADDGYDSTLHTVELEVK